MSLFWRLFLWIQLTMLATLFVFAGLSQTIGRKEALRSLDANMLMRAEGIAERQMMPDRPARVGGPGGRQGMPPDAGRGPREIGLDGVTMRPGPEFPAYSEELFQRSLKGETVFTEIQEGDVSLRVVSILAKRDGRPDRVIQIAQEIQPLQVALAAQAKALGWTLPVALAVSVLASWLVSNRISKPIRKLALVASEISESQHSRERSDADSEPGEIGMLAKSFNAMTDSLQQSLSELEASLERQKRFSSDAAHELRSPLTSIRLESENALHPAATKEEIGQSLLRIKSASARVSELTEMLLKLSRLEHSGQMIDIAQLPAAEIVAGALEMAGMQGDPRVSVSPGTSEKFLANAAASTHALRNLLENAGRYAGESGRIEIEINENSITVFNSGSTLSGELSEKVFEPFYRVAEDRTESSQGRFGLGLSIARNLMRAQGGALVHVPTRAGGTAFRMSFKKNSESS